MLSQKDEELDKVKGRSVTQGLLGDTPYHQSLSKTTDDSPAKGRQSICMPNTSLVGGSSVSMLASLGTGATEQQ